MRATQMSDATIAKVMIMAVDEVSTYYGGLDMCIWTFD